MSNFGYIYQVINVKNNKSYIGYTRYFEARMKRHFDSFDKIKILKNQRSKFYRALRKHKPQNFVVRILEQPLIKDLSEKEKYWVAFFNTWKKGYNMTPGGEGGPTNKGKKVGPFSQEARNNMRLGKLGKKYGPHTKKWNINISRGGKGIKKPSLSAQHKEKISFKIGGEKHYKFIVLDIDKIINLYNNNFSYVQIAKVMGCSPQTIKRRIILKKNNNLF